MAVVACSAVGIRDVDDIDLSATQERVETVTSDRDSEDFRELTARCWSLKRRRSHVRRLEQTLTSWMSPCRQSQSLQILDSTQGFHAVMASGFGPMAWARRGTDRLHDLHAICVLNC